MDLEQRYLFRHAILAQVASQLFLPSQKAELHACALDAFERLYADLADQLRGLAEEMASHAREGLQWPDLAPERCQQLRESLLRHLEAAALQAKADLRVSSAVILRQEMERLEWLDDRRRQKNRLHLMECCAEVRRQDILEPLARDEADSGAKNGDKGQHGRGLHFLALTARNRGQLPEAERLFREAVQVLDQPENQTLRARAAVELASVLQNRGNVVAAREVLKGTPDLPTDQTLSRIRRFIEAKCDLRLGNTSAAEASLRGLANECMTSDFPIGAPACNELSDLLRARGDLEEALAMAQSAVQQYAKYGNRAGLSSAKNNAANVLQAKGDLHAAAALRHEMLNDARECGDTRNEAIGLTNLGTELAQLGRLQEADAAFVHSRSLLKRLSFRGVEIYCCAFHLEVLLRLGRDDEARGCLADMEVLSREVDDVRARSIAACVKAIALHILDGSPDALEEALASSGLGEIPQAARDLRATRARVLADRVRH